MIIVIISFVFMSGYLKTIPENQNPEIIPVNLLLHITA